MEDEARSWMAEVKGQKAKAKSQDHEAGVKELRIRGVECWTEKKELKSVSDEQREEAAAGGRISGSRKAQKN